MVDHQHICRRCLYATSHKRLIRAHLSRVNVCSVVEGGEDIDQRTLYKELGDIKKRKHNLPCEFCHQCYSSPSSLSTHRKKCSVRQNALNNPNLKSVIENAVEETVKKLFGCVNPQTSSEIQTQNNNNAQHDINHNSHNNTNTNSNNTNNIQINIVAHGSEDIYYLKHEFLTHCVLNTRSDGIPKFIENVHLNPEHPENQNIRGVSRKQNTMEVFDGKQWNLTPANSVLDALIQKGCKVFHNHYMHHLNTDFRNEDLQTVLQSHFSDVIDASKKRRSETYYKIRRDVFFMFFKDQPNDLIVVLDPGNVVESTLDAFHANEQAANDV